MSMKQKYMDGCDFVFMLTLLVKCMFPTCHHNVII